MKKTNNLQKNHLSQFLIFYFLRLSDFLILYKISYRIIKIKPENKIDFQNDRTIYKKKFSKAYINVRCQVIKNK